MGINSKNYLLTEYTKKFGVKELDKVLYSFTDDDFCSLLDRCIHDGKDYLINFKSNDDVDIFGNIVKEVNRVNNVTIQGDFYRVLYILYKKYGIQHYNHPMQYAIINYVYKSVATVNNIGVYLYAEILINTLVNLEDTARVNIIRPYYILPKELLYLVRIKGKVLKKAKDCAKGKSPFGFNPKEYYGYINTVWSKIQVSHYDYIDRGMLINTFEYLRSEIEKDTLYILSEGKTTDLSNGLKLAL